MGHLEQSLCVNNNSLLFALCILGYSQLGKKVYKKDPPRDNVKGECRGLWGLLFIHEQ